MLASLLLVRRRPRAGRALCWAALLALVLGSWTSGPEALLRQLESRYPAPPASSLQNYVGIVVLGGALSGPERRQAHRQVGLNEQAERMTEAVALMRLHPKRPARRSPAAMPASPAKAPATHCAKVFFDAMGVDPARVVYESASRNTYENALLSASIPGVDKTQRWLLLTSAFHLPRAMGVFTHAGWNVTPWPVDYRMTPHDSWFDFSLHYGPGLWELALHEWLGFAAYRMAGWL